MSGSCFVGPDGTPSAVTYVLLGYTNSTSIAPQPGQAHTATLALSFGGKLQLDGSFQQLCPGKGRSSSDHIELDIVMDCIHQTRGLSLNIRSTYWGNGSYENDHDNHLR